MWLFAGRTLGRVIGRGAGGTGSGEYEIRSDQRVVIHANKRDIVSAADIDYRIAAVLRKAELAEFLVVIGADIDLVAVAVAEIADEVGAAVRLEDEPVGAGW